MRSSPVNAVHWAAPLAQRARLVVLQVDATGESCSAHTKHDHVTLTLGGEAHLCRCPLLLRAAVGCGTGGWGAPIINTLKMSAVTSSHSGRFLAQSLRQCTAAAATARPPGMAFIATVYVRKMGDALTQKVSIS